MQELILITAVSFSALLLASCNINSKMSSEDAAKEVWEVIKAHNKAWSESEDINEQLKYVHNEVVFVRPPFKEILKGKTQYKTDYENWMKHAKVEYFREVNPVIKVYGDGTFAIVSYNIDMSFTYDAATVNDWKGVDMMTLVKENGKWLVTSDMYARETKQTE